MPLELDHRFREAGPPTRTHDHRAFERFADAIPDEFVRPIALGGSPADVRAQMDALIAAGADEIMAFPLVAHGETVESTIDLFAEACSLGQPAS